MGLASVLQRHVSTVHIRILRVIPLFAHRRSGTWNFFANHPESGKRSAHRTLKSFMLTLFLVCQIQQHQSQRIFLSSLFCGNRYIRRLELAL
jgi:hypothetical protein